jgi:hypothetical protein
MLTRLFWRQVAIRDQKISGKLPINQRGRRIGRRASNALDLTIGSVAGLRG